MNRSRVSQAAPLVFLYPAEWLAELLVEGSLKYRPDFPDRFGSIEHARMFGTDFFPWYNTEHRHSGLGLHTPHDVHFGLAGAKRAARAVVLAAAYAATPERFIHRPPRPALLPTAAWINPPKLLTSGDVAQ